MSVLICYNFDYRPDCIHEMGHSYLQESNVNNYILLIANRVDSLSFPSETSLPKFDNIS